MDLLNCGFVWLLLWLGYFYVYFMFVLFYVLYVILVYVVDNFMVLILCDLVLSLWFWIAFVYLLLLIVGLIVFRVVVDMFSVCCLLFCCWWYRWIYIAYFIMFVTWVNSSFCFYYCAVLILLLVWGDYCVDTCWFYVWVWVDFGFTACFEF